MKIGNGIFYHGDCLAEMSKIPDNSVDLICTDLPYETTAESWDQLIPFEPLWEHYLRVAKPNIPIVLFCAQPFTTTLANSNRELLKYSMVWIKNTPAGFAHAKNMPLKSHEDILVFSTGIVAHEGKAENRMPYYPQGLQYNPQIKKNKEERYSQTAFGNRPSHKPTYVQEYTNYPTTVLQFDVQRDEGHSTQKPVDLIEYIIKSYSKPGETVLDSTAGSGTLAIAAERSKRKWICIERDDAYYKKATDRVKRFVGGTPDSQDEQDLFY